MQVKKCSGFPRNSTKKYKNLNKANKKIKNPTKCKLKNAAALPKMQKSAKSKLARVIAPLSF